MLKHHCWILYSMINKVSLPVWNTISITMAKAETLQCSPMSKIPVCCHDFRWHLFRVETLKSMSASSELEHLKHRKKNLGNFETFPWHCTEYEWHDKLVKRFYLFDSFNTNKVVLDTWYIYQKIKNPTFSIAKHWI